MPLSDPGLERTFVMALIANPAAHDALPDEIDMHVVWDLQARATFMAIVNVRARGAAVTAASVRAELAATGIEAAVSGLRGKHDRGWFDDLVERSTPPDPSAAPIAGWAKTLLRLSARRNAAIDEGEERLRAEHQPTDSPGPASYDEPTPESFQNKLTELGNAKRFAIMFGDSMRFVRKWRAWLSWDGRRWCRDEMGAEDNAAKRVVERLYADAARVTARAARLASEGGNPKDATELAAAIMKHATASAKANAIGAMVKLARSESPIAAVPSMFDRDSWVMNVENGTLDLRTGDLRPHHRGDMLTLLANVTYDPDATCPLWDRFLARVLPEEETRAMLHRFLGYCLTGDVSEHVLVFAHGLGGNGKSVLFDTVMAILGDYAKRAAPDLVLAKFGESHPTEYADLEGCRLALVSEIDQGRQWSEATIKRITGDTTIKARRMRQDFVEFPATHKLVIYGNTKPEVRGTDDGIWRRMRLLPFTVTIPEQEKDRGLIAKLLAERAGIFAWLVRGCREWQRVGVGQSAEVAEATRIYREDNDTIGEWISERCVVREGAETPTTRLYESYKAWCIESRREPWKQPTWRERLLERPGGIFKASRTKAARCISGLALLAPASDDSRHQ